MRILFIVLYGSALLFNILCGLLLDSYKAWNVALVSAVLVVGALFQVLATIPGLKDGFRVSLPFLFVAINIVQAWLGIVTPEKSADNVCFITIAALFFLQVVLSAIVYVVSEKNN